MRFGLAAWRGRGGKAGERKAGESGFSYWSVRPEGVGGIPNYKMGPYAPFTRSLINKARIDNSSYNPTLYHISPLKHLNPKP